MTTFSVSIDNTEIKDNTLQFELNGSDEYGLDKSIVTQNTLIRNTLYSISC